MNEIQPNKQSPEYVQSVKLGNLLSEKNSTIDELRSMLTASEELAAAQADKIEAQAERIYRLQELLEGITMFPDVRNHISSQYPGLVKKIQSELERTS